MTRTIEIHPPHPDLASPRAQLEATFQASLAQFVAQRDAPQPIFLRPDDYWLDQAPSQLVCRFYLARPARPEASWLPWGNFPVELYLRSSYADACRQRMLSALTPDEWQHGVQLSADDVRKLYDHEHWLTIERLGDPACDFDLHDVYLCMEGHLFQLYAQREHPDPDELTRHGFPRATSRDELELIASHYHDCAQRVRSLLRLIAQVLPSANARTEHRPA